MEILYISGLSSEKILDDIKNKTGNNPGYAIQKFSRMLVKGFIDNGYKISALSNAPTNRYITGRRFCNIPKDSLDEIDITYIPFWDIPLIKHLGIVLYTFFFVCKWGIKNRKSKAICCDVLSISACLGALVASKLIGIKSIGVVTDLPAFLLINNKITLRRRLISKINGSYLSSYSYYVLLTEQMNKAINKHHSPYIVMEGLCYRDSDYSALRNLGKHVPPTILYAGGINERNGIETFVKAFLKSGITGCLVLYGDGEYAEELKVLSKENECIDYRGVASNKVVVEESIRATLIVNPRFSNQEHTKYSFPSKNIESMSTGTPLLTTKLPGIPSDYYSYNYFFDEESVDGYAAKLRELFGKDSIELHNFGLKAKEYVLRNKNNVVQAKRIMKLVTEK